MPGPVVVLVSHAATRTGAPAMALRVGITLRELGCEVRPVLRTGGSRAAEFRALGETRHELRPTLVSVARAKAGRNRFLCRLDERLARAALRRSGGEIVWCNSVESANYVRPALALGRSVVLHSHEVEPALSAALSGLELERQSGALTLVACSVMAADQLAASLGVDRTNVSVIRSSPDVTVDPGIDRSTQPRSRFEVGMCGFPSVAKGVDLFSSLAEEVGGDRVRWRWLGGRRPRGIPTSAKVEFEPPVADARAALAELDVFVLTSRSESASLVVLEAMSVGVPVVAFAVGSLPELVGDAGVVVPVDDVRALAAAVRRLLDDVVLREEVGRKGRSRAAELCDPVEWTRSVEAVLQSAQDRCGAA